jgi:hypothetical protein
MSVEILLPVPPRTSAEPSLREWRPLPPDAVLALVDNTMGGAADLLAAIGRRLQSTGVASTTFVARKPVPGRALADAQRTEVLERADLVVAAVGVCGGCTSGSVRDAALAAEAGMPAAVIVTTPFRRLAELTRANLGATTVEILVVDHPLWTRDAAWIDLAGRSAADRFAAAAGLIAATV